MDIRSLHSYLATILETLAITQPYAITLQKAWKFVPPVSASIADLPCVFSTYELKPVIFHSGLLHRQYAINMQLIAGKMMPEADVSCDIASSFLEALITKLSGDQLLGGNVTVINGLRGATPDTLTRFEFGKQSYVGLDLFLDITMSSAANHGVQP